MTTDSEVGCAESSRLTIRHDSIRNRVVDENLVDGVTTSVYDAANRLLTAESLSGMTTYSYDAAGNRRTVEEPSGDVTTYTWNGQNQVVQVELPDDEIVTYVWAPVNKDAEERIASRDDGVDSEQLLWDNNNVLREADELGVVEAEYTYQPQPYGDLVSDRRDSESHFYRFDALGSTTGLTDDSGNVTDGFRYTAFGKEASTSGTTETPYRWIGQLGYRQDETTGLANLRARDYDPQTGQFVSEDPLDLDAGDSNFYRYVGNRPVGYVDPSGHILRIDDVEGVAYKKVYFFQAYIFWWDAETYIGTLEGETVTRIVDGVAFTKPLERVRDRAAYASFDQSPQAWDDYFRPIAQMDIENCPNSSYGGAQQSAGGGGSLDVCLAGVFVEMNVLKWVVVGALIEKYLPIGFVANKAKFMLKKCSRGGRKLQAIYTGKNGKKIAYEVSEAQTEKLLNDLRKKSNGNTADAKVTKEFLDELEGTIKAGAGLRPQTFKHAWIKHDLYNQLQGLVGQADFNKFIAALKKGVVGPVGESGIKVLDKPIGKHTHELKIGGSAQRLLGSIGDDNVLIFDKFVRGGLH